MTGLREGVSAAILNLAFLFLMPAQAQNLDEAIELKPQKFPFVPNEYFIEQVIDQRKDKSSLGLLISKGNALGQNPITRKIILKDGTANAIKGFITKSLPSRSDLRAVIVNLQELIITETQQPDGLISGRVQIFISFEMERNNEPVKLVEYKGGPRYTRSVNNLTVMEPVLVKTIINAMQYFNNWMNREAATNVKLAENVRLTFTDFDREFKNDTLFYSAGRPLAWSDFKSAPDASSRFAAEIFPFFSFDESSKIANSVIKVDLTLKVYLVRSFSWVKGFARSANTLNHEQRHFDIVKIAAERFKKKIRNENLTVDNYQGILSVEYLESLREMHRLQVQYDLETKHGTDQAGQNRWNRRIDEELKIR